MDFGLTEEQELLVKAARDFARRECPPELVRRCAEEGAYDRDLWRKFAATGWLGLAVDPRYGGSGGSVLDLALFLEVMAPVQEAVAPMFASMCFGGHLLETMGTEEQKAELLPRLVRGEAQFALSITEPGGGTDVLGAMRTRAERVDGGWVIDGAKAFTSASSDADYLVVVARTSPPEGGKRSRGISAFLVDRDAPGVTLQRMPVMNNEDTNAVFYEGVRVDDGRVLGEVGRGFHGLLAMLNLERLGIGAMCVGWAQAALDECRAYALQREAFGGVIGRFQAVQHHLARMHLLVEQARLMVHKAAWMQSQGLPCGLEATAAKAVAAENAFQACDLGMQVLGGLGYTLESDLNRYWRRVRLFRLAPVSNEMALNFIAEGLGMPRSY